LLASNLASAASDEPSEAQPEREALADLVLCGGALALVMTGVVVIGSLLGGPAPNARLWLALGPLQVVPLAILFGMLLAPGGVIRDPAVGWPRRLALGLGGLGTYMVAIAALNLPTFFA
jgi:hypothetical protein